MNGKFDYSRGLATKVLKSGTTMKRIMRLSSIKGTCVCVLGGGGGEHDINDPSRWRGGWGPP